MEEKQPDLNRDAEQLVRDGLDWLRLERDVQAAAATRKTQMRRQARRRWVGGLLLLCLVGAAGFFYLNPLRHTTTPPVENIPPTPPQNMPQSIENQPDTQPSVAPGRSSKTPIAYNNPTQKPTPSRYSAPAVRGTDNPTDAKRKALLDEIWHTEYLGKDLSMSADFASADRLLRNRDFEGAYVDLQRLTHRYADNDTLRLLKGYCLLEMGEGAAALDYLRPLSARHPDWQSTLDWQQALALLLAGFDEDAQQQFRRISDKPGHPYRIRSQRAVQLLSGR
jgi:hypothetical protein